MFQFQSSENKQTNKQQKTWQKWYWLIRFMRNRHKRLNKRRNSCEKLDVIREIRGYHQTNGLYFHPALTTCARRTVLPTLRYGSILCRRADMVKSDRAYPTIFVPLGRRPSRYRSLEEAKVSTKTSIAVLYLVLKQKKIGQTV